MSGCVGVCNWYGCWPCGGIGHAWCGSSTARVMFRLLQRPGRRVTWAFDGVTCACECVPRVARSVAWACKRSQCQTRMSPRPGDLDTLVCHPALLSATGETDPSGKGRATGEESLSSVRLPAPGVVVPVDCSGVPVLESQSWSPGPGAPAPAALSPNPWALRHPCDSLGECVLGNTVGDSQVASDRTSHRRRTICCRRAVSPNRQSGTSTGSCGDDG